MNDNYQVKSYQLLAPHKKLKRIAKVLVLIFILIGASLAFLPWQQTAFGTGKVVALSPNEREQNISAPVEGRLDQWYVHDGSYVKKGDPIVLLKDNDPNLLQRLNMEKRAVELSLDLYKKAATTAFIDVERQKKLYESGISSRKAFEQANFKYLDYKNKIEKTKIELAKVRVRISRVKRQLVKAPLSGTIIKRMSGMDSVLVKQGDVLAVLVPDTKSRAVTLWLRGNDVPLIKPGQQVRLQFEGWPAIQFSGWPSVAIGSFGGVVQFVDPTDNGRGYFRILIVPGENNKWPGAKFLRQGVRAHGWVMLSQVRLGYELWRQFNGFPPTVESPDKSSEEKDDASIQEKST